MSTTTMSEKRSARRAVEPMIQPATVREHAALMRELPAREGQPFTLDPHEIDRFVTSAMKRAGRNGLALAEHGLYLQIDPLVLLFQGRTEGVRRTACVPLAPGVELEGDDVITFPEASVLEIEIPDGAAFGDAIRKSLDRVRAWSLESPENRLGSFARLHLIRDPRAPSGVRTTLRFERLTNTNADD